MEAQGRGRLPTVKASSHNTAGNPTPSYEARAAGLRATRQYLAFVKPGLLMAGAFLKV